MNKNYRQGAEDVAEIAGNGFKIVAYEVKGAGRHIEENAENQHKINDAVISILNEMKFGFAGKVPISDESKILLISALKSIKVSSDSLSADACTYYEYFYNILDVNPLREFDPEKLGYLKLKEAEHVLYILLEYKAFFKDNSALCTVADIINHINISPNKRNEFDLSIEETIRDVGFEGILNRYRNNAYEKKNERLEEDLNEEKLKNKAYKEEADAANRKAADAERKAADAERKAKEDARRCQETDESKLQVELDKMVKAADKAVIAATAAACGIGAVPIPFADAPLLISNQVALMASIAVIFKIDIKKDGLKTLVVAALGVGGATFLGRTIVTNLLKFIPGIGTVAGGVIAATTAGIITYAIGYSFIEMCKDVKRGKLREEDVTSKEGIAKFKEYFKSFAKKKAKEEKVNKD